ncbi:hypothetical protein ACJJIL_07775 [Microbulbifer sp. EKSA005]|uniref:hypothetical protein n=1 Tax=Microbulbifer sp. EKSA005 TaxID=3243364 RepID=UPI004041F061
MKRGQNYIAVIIDLSEAVVEWNMLIPKREACFFELNVNNAYLKIGMSSEQVKSAFAGGSTVGVIQYYNNL